MSANVLRYNEYYNQQSVYDNLYERSKNNATNSLNLYKEIIKRENILLAYRTMKKNKGSVTDGVDGYTINDKKILTENEFVNEIINRLADYKPKPIKRIEIPKHNGETRPLGIPTISDRIIQQAIKQVLEPIVEAKFYNHSYGFRPNRSTRHAIARCQSIINRTGLHYAVDIDIKGFFDNVNHNKLIKQLYSIGIKDKRVLTIISKMLKAPVKNYGVQRKGTPQGAILSPLLSNVVLNELDQWVYSQWEGFNTEKTYADQTKKIRAIKESSNLKEMYIVRYADDFKIFTRTYEQAVKIFHATKKFLKQRLGLDISESKSKITNLKKNKTEFLGFTLKAIRKRKKYIAKTDISITNRNRIVTKAKELLKAIQKKPSSKNLQKYNAYIISIKNYFKYATNVAKNLSEIQYRHSRTLYNRLKRIGKYGIPKNPTEIYKKYNPNNYKTFTVNEIALHKFEDVRTVNNMNFSQNINNYTEDGRNTINSIKPHIETEIVKLMKANTGENIEYQDNRISRYSMQKGICVVTKRFLHHEEVHCHHIKPKFLGGTDIYKNLVILHKDVHKLIHANTEQTIKKYMEKLQLNAEQMSKVNMYRKKCKLDEVICN